MSTIKNVIIFAAGAIVGSLVTYKCIKTKYEDLAQEEIDSVKEHFSNRKVSIPKESASAENEERKTTLMYKKTNTNKVPYDQISKVEKVDDEEPDEEEMIVMAKQKCDFPYIITDEEFNNEMLHYDKLTITYYDKDDVLVDESEEIITDQAACVGEEALISFGEGSGDADIVYVRNDNIAVDYEVINARASYEEVVFGIKPAAPKKIRKKVIENE